MKKMKKIMQLCLAVLTVITVVSVAKIDSKAATQITGFKQVMGTWNSVHLYWDTDNLPSNTYTCVFYRPWGSGEAWKTTDSSYIDHLTPGTSYEMKMAGYSDYERTVRVAETPNSIEVVTAPRAYAPLSLDQTKATTTSATLTWNAYPGANCYKVIYSKVSKNNREQGVQQYVSGNQFKATGLGKNERSLILVIPCRRSSTGFIVQSPNDDDTAIYAVVMPTTTPVISSAGVNSANKTAYFNTIDGDSEYFADGYDFDIYRVRGNKRIARLKSRDFGCDVKNKAFGSRELFKVRVRAFVKTDNGKKFYTKWSPMYCFYENYLHVYNEHILKNPRGISLSWLKIKGARGYKIYAATKNNPKKFKVVANIKNGNVEYTSIYKFNNKPLKKNQKYYFYIKPYYKSGKKTIEAIVDSICGVQSVKYK